MADSHFDFGPSEIVISSQHKQRLRSFRALHFMEKEQAKAGLIQEQEQLLDAPPKFNERSTLSEL